MSVNYKFKLISFLETEETLSILNDLISDISSIKQALSALETKFTKEEPLKIFRNHLEQEYANFNFAPPDFWHIKSFFLRWHISITCSFFHYII